jgi:hypothetical protein
LRAQEGEGVWCGCITARYYSAERPGFAWKRLSPVRLLFYFSAFRSALAARTSLSTAHALTVIPRILCAHYHARSNVESTFSAMKRKFGDSVRSRDPIAQVNDVLCKALAFNPSILVHAMYELGIEPQFAGLTSLQVAS